MLKRILSLAMILLFGSIQVVRAEQGLIVAAGAGYKKLVEELSTAYTAKTGVPIRKIFGNMGQVTSQTQESGEVDFVIGDKRYLDATSFSFTGEVIVGQGKLIAAVSRNVSVKSLADLTNKIVNRIAIPDAKKAIYGRAAMEYFANTEVWKKIKPKVLVVGTVPQVSAYLVSGEVDVGFINLTEALAIKDKVGLLLPVNERLYTPILIVAKRLQTNRNQAEGDSFASFLQSEKAKTIITKQGL